MEAGIPIQVLLPLVIAAMMLGVGMSLRVSDFTALLGMPHAAGIGLLTMFVVFPGLAFLVAGTFPLTAELSIGLVLLAASPSASTSTLFTYLARGDAALSLTLTAVSKLLPVVTIPLYVSIAARLFADTDTDTALTLGFADISERVVQMVLLPTLIGMALQHFAPAFTDRARPYVIRIAVTALVLLIAALVYRERQKLPDMLLAAGPAALTLCLLGMACAYALALLTNLRPQQTTAIVIETGMQSGGTAIAIAAGLLAAPAMAVPAAVYSLIMYLVTAVFVHLRRATLSRAAA
ncbi:bile acid:sodium symporter family protein [Sedimenticola hydrogenitrophicus]|uniref:bile acid:sodium symporter family protein n=1 Tax=Sedimenticola hydrogenitrophicus TaxID=2967975 RepID=UPI0021A29C7F|nr:bile acid:sodium symporter family protein [Sedimenticola hydrogenitrophicus]